MWSISMPDPAPSASQTVAHQASPQPVSFHTLRALSAALSKLLGPSTGNLPQPIPLTAGHMRQSFSKCDYGVSCTGLCLYLPKLLSCHGASGQQ